MDHNKCSEGQGKIGLKRGKIDFFVIILKFILIIIICSRVRKSNAKRCATLRPLRNGTRSVPERFAKRQRKPKSVPQQKAKRQCNSEKGPQQKEKRKRFWKISFGTLKFRSGMKYSFLFLSFFGSFHMKIFTKMRSPLVYSLSKTALRRDSRNVPCMIHSLTSLLALFVMCFSSVWNLECSTDSERNWHKLQFI